MNEFRKEDTYVLINKPYAEGYVPVDLFNVNSESSIAEFYGDGVRTLGVFNMRFFDSPDDTYKRDKIPLRTLKYPNIIETHPSEISESTHLIINGIEDDFYILKYYMDDILMDSALSKNILNCEAYMNALIKAKIPRNIGYDDLLLNWVKNFKTNSISPGTKALTLQIIVAENVRWAKDPSIPFRKMAAHMKTITPEDYILYNMNNVSSNSSVLSGIGFERVSEKMTSGLVMSKKNTKQAVSPLEKVIIM